MSGNSLYRLPDGNETYDVNLYVETWRKLGDDVCSLIPDSYCNAFDPGLNIVRGPNGSSFSLPADFALKVQELVNRVGDF